MIDDFIRIIFVQNTNDRWLCISSTVYVFSIDGDFYLF